MKIVKKQFLMYHTILKKSRDFVLKTAMIHFLIYDTFAKEIIGNTAFFSILKNLIYSKKKIELFLT